MQHGSGDYAAYAPAGGHYYPHNQYAPPGPNPHPPIAAAPDAPIPGGGYASAPTYGYPEQQPSAPSYSQPPPQYAGYPPYNPAPYPPEPSPAPYYAYPQPTHPAPAVPEPSPQPLPYDAPYYGGGYQQQPAAGYGDDDYLDEGAYAYTGDGGAEPYGARGTAPTRSGAAMFDDYGRSIGPSSGGAEQPRAGGSGSVGGSGFGKIARAVPKAESHEDAGGGAQKFRVKLLPEGAGSPTDVLCQV